MDLTPGYREMPAPHALRDVLECVWVRVTGAAEELRIVPDACSDVIWQRGEGTTVAGPDTTAKVFERGPGAVMIGIRFLPGAGGPALGVPLDLLRDERVDVADVNRGFDLDPELPPAEVIARLVSGAAERDPDPLVREAARRVVREDVRSVARDLGLSERQLRRRFHAAVGYGPKTLARILRFRRFVRAVQGGRSDLAGIAFEAGYADQAHLTRESTRLAGMPPSALARAWRS